MKTLLERIADMAACVGGSVEKVLLDAAKEIKALRAKVAEMEKQEPAYWGPKHAIEGGSTTVIVGKFPVNPTDAPLYALPGAQPAPSVPDGWKLVPIEPTPMMKTAGIGVEVYLDPPASSDCLTWSEVEAIYTAMLAAAPEAKP